MLPSLESNRRPATLWAGALPTGPWRRDTGGRSWPRAILTPSRKAKRHQSVEFSFFLFTQQITANNYSRVLKCEGQHINRWRLLFWVPFLRGAPSRHPKALHPDVWRRHRSPSRIKSTLVKQVCKYCTFKCVTDDFAHDMVFN